MRLGCSQNARVFDSFLEAKIVEKHVRNAFFTESAENRVLGPLLGPKIEPMTPSGSIFGVPRGSPNQLKNGKNASRKASETRPFKKKFRRDGTGGYFSEFDSDLGLRGWSGRPRGTIFGRFWMKFRTLFDTLGQPLFQKTTAFPPRKSVRICVACLILAEGLERHDCLVYACA